MIAISQPQLLGREREYVLDCLDKVQLSGGEYVRKFEEAFAKFCGVKHAVATSSGTTALHLALKVSGIGPGQRVIVPGITYVATANAVAYCGAEPVFCDVLSGTWNIDPEKVGLLLRSSSRITAIIPVHLYGVPANLTALREVISLSSRRISLVEDAAEAHGAKHRGTRVGGLGDVGVFSFYGNKILTCGEGGMLTTNSEALATELRFYRGQAMSLTRRYWHTAIGYNYRMTNIQAAMGLAQLESYDEHARRRRQVMNWYRQEFARHEILYMMQECEEYNERADWMCAVTIPANVSRNDVMVQLEKQEIETRPVFPLISEMPPYFYGPRPQLPVAARTSRLGINLPTHGALGEEDVRYVVGSLVDSLKMYGLHARLETA